MVEKFTKLLHKEFHNINEAALLLGFFTLLSQILGLFRDRLLASSLGTGLPLDIYYAAFKIPDLIFVLAASLVSVTILIPFFTEKLGKNKEDKERGKFFIDSIFTSFFVFIIIVSIIMFFITPFLVKILVPGFDTEAIEKIVSLSRIMLLSPIFLGLSNLLGTITQTFKKFFVYALSPIFYNLGIIIGILFLYPKFGLKGLAFGVVFGAILHMLIQLPIIIKNKFVPKFVKIINFKEIKNVVLISFPRTLTLALSNIVFLVLIAIGSTLSEGTISILNLSKNLQSVPLAIIGVSYSVASFPVLVEFFNSKKIDEFFMHIVKPMKKIIFWSIPIIVLFIVLRAQIVRVILGSGEFTWTDTRLTAASLAIFIISVVAQSLILLLVRGYYAAGETIRPLIINFFSSILIVLMAFFFVYLFKNILIFRYFFETILRISDVPGSHMVMLPLAFSLGIFVNFFILWKFFRKDFKFKNNFGIKKTFFQSFSSSIIMGFVVYKCLQIFAKIFDINTFYGILLQGFLSGIIGIIFCILILILIKNQDILEIYNSLKKKFWKSKVVISE